MMNDSFWRVNFVHTDDEYYFHNYEDAAAFFLESYFDEIDMESETDVIDVNNQVAEENGIENYGYVTEIFFEK